MMARYHRTYSLLGTRQGATPRVHVLTTGEAVCENTRGPDTRAEIAAILRAWRELARRYPRTYRIERERAESA